MFITIRRYCLFFVILLIPIVTIGQYTRKVKKVPELEKVKEKDGLKTDYSIIYGNFIQRLGFSSGGFRQGVTLVNLETHETVILEVKGENKVNKENIFCNFIKPGIYAITSYTYAKGTAFGGFKLTHQPIYRKISAENLRERIKGGEVKEEDLSLYAFTFDRGSVVYLGTWHFDDNIVYFSDDKNELDNNFRTKFKGINFLNAKTNLPN